MPPVSTRAELRLGFLAVAASAALFSAKSVFIKMSYAHGAEPTALMALRTLYCLPFFLGTAVAAWWKGRGVRLPMSRRDMAAVAGLGLLGFYLSMTFNMQGLLLVSAGMERMILYVYPTLVLVFAAWFFRKPLERGLGAPLALTYVGIALSFGGEALAGQGSRPYLGGFLVFLSAVCYALFMVFQGRLIGRLGPERLTSYGMLAGCAAALAQFAATRPLEALAQPAEVQGLAFLTAALCTAAPAYLLGYGIQRIGAGRASVVSCVGPVVTFLLAMSLLGEKAGWLQVAGLALVLAGGLKLGLAKRPGPAPSRGRGSERLADLPALPLPEPVPQGLPRPRPQASEQPADHGREEQQKQRGGEAHERRHLPAEEVVVAPVQESGQGQPSRRGANEPREESLTAAAAQPESGEVARQGRPPPGEQEAAQQDEKEGREGGHVSCPPAGAAPA